MNPHPSRASEIWMRVGNKVIALQLSYHLSTQTTDPHHVASLKTKNSAGYAERT